MKYLRNLLKLARLQDLNSIEHTNVQETKIIKSVWNLRRQPVI